MPTTTKPQNYFGLSSEQAESEKARAVIMPVTYETTVKGAKDGAKAIYDASQELELFDDELWVEPYKIGIQRARRRNGQAQQICSGSFFHRNPLSLHIGTPLQQVLHVKEQFLGIKGFGQINIRPVFQPFDALFSVCSCRQ